MDAQIPLLIGVVFVGVACATAAVLSLLMNPEVAQQRLARVAVAPGVGAPGTQETLLGDDMTSFARKVRAFVPKSPKEMNRIQRLLASAGYHGPWPSTLFGLAQVLVPLAIFAAGISVLGTGKYLVFVLIATAIGSLLPKLWLGRAIGARRKAIQNGLPDAIDLMIVCIEAGSGIDQAINKVAEELALPYPALAHELDLISVEMRAGKARIDAFKNFADRTKVDDVRSLVAMLVQTDRFGTSIGQALRTHADTSRTKRRQRAEEKAAKLGVKLLFPLVFCLFPAFYVLVLGPSMIRIFRMLVHGNMFN
jgi:tight adherence protein C